MDLDSVPERLAIIGGGPVGLEFAQIFSSFGAAVSVFEAGTGILAHEDEEVSSAMAGFLEAQGVSVVAPATVRSVSATAHGKLIVYEAKGRASSEEFQEILVATGRTPALDALNLKAAGVSANARGISVDSGMRTNVPHIWAAGDVTGTFLFTLIAWEQGAVAAANAMGEGPRSLNYNILPRVTFCDPEVASVGLTEQQAREAGHALKIGRFNYADLSLGIAARENEGFFKIVAEAGSGRILGGHIVGTESSSLIHEVAAAMASGMTVRQVGDTLHAYPTFSEGVRYACQPIP
jgi:pyruvate/2-oxoglutarate dehydrogenase complex dihydrolipoamide dehydrogenase (E3) component